MMTAAWSTYSGPGRLALSPEPQGTPGGYRLAPRPLRLLRPRSPAEVRATLLGLDPVAVAVEQHRTVYPWTPVLMGDAGDPTCTYRRAVADWLSRAMGMQVNEMDPEAYFPIRADFREWVRLRRLNSNSTFMAA